MWKKVLREYFAFPKKERRAIWVLFVIWSVVLSYQIYTSYFIEFDPYTYSYEIVLNEKLKAFDEQKIKDAAKSRNLQQHHYKNTYFNYISVEQLRSMGISEKTTIKIIEQKENGLKIYTAEDLTKIIDVDSQTIRILKNNLRFYPSKKYFNVNPSIQNKSKSIEKIDINTADTMQLDLIKGIGMGTARRVYKYKERLGGFIAIEQLKEVWGMDSGTYEILKKSIIIEKNSQKHININTADLKTLGSHPYIGYSLAKLIVNYRLQHGNYTKLEDLLQIHVMNENIFSKIESYISISDD